MTEKLTRAKKIKEKSSENLAEILISNYGLPEGKPIIAIKFWGLKYIVNHRF